MPRNTVCGQLSSLWDTPDVDLVSLQKLSSRCMSSWMCLWITARFAAHARCAMFLVVYRSLKSAFSLQKMAESCVALLCPHIPLLLCQDILYSANVISAQQYPPFFPWLCSPGLLSQSSLSDWTLVLYSTTPVSFEQLLSTGSEISVFAVWSLKDVWKYADGATWKSNTAEFWAACYFILSSLSLKAGCQSIPSH